MKILMRGYMEFMFILLWVKVYGGKSYIPEPYDLSKKTEEQIVEERENSIKEQLKRGKRALSKGVDEYG